MSLSTVHKGSHLRDEDIAYVTELVKEAGALAASMRAGVSISEKTGPHDRVTDADFELSKLISKRLADRFKSDVIVSEEDSVHAVPVKGDRVWLVDPIDGTDNYITNDGQYAVMIGLIVEGKPVFGWVHAPILESLYFGGPGQGAWRVSKNGPAEQYGPVTSMQENDHARLIMGWRDRKNHPWIKDLPKVTIVKTGSIGLKVAKILDGQADLFVHLSQKLKMWDTAGPVAIALGGGLEVGSMESDGLDFALPLIKHDSSVIIGKTGSINWARKNLRA